MSVYYYCTIFIPAYGMSRNSESNTWSSTPVKSSYSSLGSNSGSSGLVMSSRPDPWTNSNSNREIETAVWQRPPQPPADKYVIKQLNHNILYIYTNEDFIIFF